ncbi:MAG: hypothetical protein NC900_00050 [Candidatus Omnitrophica bacterium]|nr:hypothetical protein [Candidatus Omnitrophota bacterium]MCM8799116.1 hypothetical protein [Candidatus Omnitrophota bacterium]
MSEKVAFIGKEDVFEVFKIFGFFFYHIDSKADLKKVLDLAIKENNKVIFIQEDFVEEEIFELYGRRSFPIIVPLQIYGRKPNLIKRILSKASLKGIGKELL